MSKNPKEHLALYKSGDEWRLITREMSTEKHALKMAEQYKEHGYETKVVSLYLLLKSRDV